jgi:hypothetical protein
MGLRVQGFGEETVESMDVDAEVDRLEQYDRGEEEKRAGLDASVERDDQKIRGVNHGKPLVLMSEIEFKCAWDDLERGDNSLLGGMLDEARTSRSGEIARTSVVVLVPPDGEERFIYGSSEYGDDEGRASAASCWRTCLRCDALVKGERLERLLIETRLANLQTTCRIDPVADDEGHEWIAMNDEDQVSGKHETLERSNARWVSRIAEARRRKSMVLMAVGILSVPKGMPRLFCEDVELGDDEARRE